MKYATRYTFEEIFILAIETSSGSQVLGGVWPAVYLEGCGLPGCGSWVGERLPSSILGVWVRAACVAYLAVSHGCGRWVGERPPPSILGVWVHMVGGWVLGRGSIASARHLQLSHLSGEDAIHLADAGVLHGQGGERARGREESSREGGAWVKGGGGRSR